MGVGETITVGEVFAILFGISLVIGVWLSLLPQLINIIRSKSTVGIAFLTLLFANINSFMTMLNNLLLNVGEISNCHDGTVGGVECTRCLLVFAQLVVGWIMYVINYGAFLYYFIDEKLSNEAEERSKESRYQSDLLSESVNAEKTKVKLWNRNYSRWNSTEWKFIVFGTAIYAAIIAFLTLIATAFMVMFPLIDPRTNLLAEVIGYVGSVFVVIQWSPQIYRTIKFKSSGSFSIVMILMFVPGCFTIMFFMAIVEKQSFSLWISYLLSGLQQIVLLGLLIYYDYIRPRLFKTTIAILEVPENTADEETALIKSEVAQYSEITAGPNK
jgi:uncharacterized protein with PQ loop repeat